ncbi:hypothetical protein IQ241_21295 [Romeria aff. gracilis LEGE 07310]|uniref:Uncharacterized protein n=1 Tax=Vasconcelosia minhoensis LEGE 07310 TaxID=915328 RepID=A0A8J7B0A2_9CYAN|nr:hypothetical protein [Romeria gracilis]MBE9079797.1 hypothetical protein [Romeria aff. gracilis LEGE 07310]
MTPIQNYGQNQAKRLLYDLMFGSAQPRAGQDWADDVWGLSPTLGESAAIALEVLDKLIETCSAAQLQALLQDLHNAYPEMIQDLGSAQEWQSLGQGSRPERN